MGPHDAPTSGAEAPGLQRRLGTLDGALLTIGSVIGTGIFLVPADVARALPHAGLVLVAWAAGGLLALCGALSLAELGASHPRAGGIYHFLKEAYGPLWGFLYGWTAFLVIMSGGIAAIAMGFGEYLGSWLPWFSGTHVLCSVPLFGWTWTLSGGQVAAALAIVVLTAVNHVGLAPGAWLQNALTLVKVASIAAFLGCGFWVAARVHPDWWQSLGAAADAARGAAGAAADIAARAGDAARGAAGGAGVGAAGVVAAPFAWVAGFGAAMIATLWTYDGWYGLTFSAGEMRRPGRSLPLGLMLGTGAVVVLYLLLNVLYLRALPLDELARSPRVGEDAVRALLGPTGARLFSLAIIVSILGCLAATILYSSRIYQPMAADGVFFRALAEISPKHHVPVRSLWLQSGWALVLTLSGSYSELYTYVTFASVLALAAAGAAVIVLRRTQPDLPRPYRTWGYPLVPLLFVGSSALLVVSTLWQSPRESIAGLALVALGLPAYAWWRRGARTPHDGGSARASD